MTTRGLREEKMNRQQILGKNLVTLGLVALGCLIVASPALAGTSSQPMSRGAWLLERGNLEGLALTGERFEQGEIGGGAAGPDFYEEKTKSGPGRGPGAGVTILASAVLPGAGEALMGYKRGYLMMALDIFCWTQVSKYHNDGKDFTDKYYAFADEHYSDEDLLQGYVTNSDDQERDGQGDLYFNIEGDFLTVEDLENLPLYVTKEEDRREYYENAGKWDQFIFGWDDYTNPTTWGYLHDYEATGTTSDLQQPWVSRNREIYRGIRDDANDAYKTRDRYLYVNIGLRVVSVFQVAYLNGLLTGNSSEPMKVSGHTVEIISEPRGLYRGTLAARVSF
jgi:hypothetical protein